MFWFRLYFNNYEINILLKHTVIDFSPTQSIREEFKLSDIPIHIRYCCWIIIPYLHCVIKTSIPGNLSLTVPTGGWWVTWCACLSIKVVISIVSDKCQLLPCIYVFCLSVLNSNTLECMNHITISTSVYSTYLWVMVIFGIKLIGRVRWIDSIDIWIGSIISCIKFDIHLDCHCWPPI